MKRIISAAMVFLLLVCMTVASAGTAGTASDPLVSLSYVNGTYIDTLKTEAKAEIKKTLDPVYAAAAAKLTGTANDYAGHTFAAGYTTLILASGKTVDLVTGSGFVLLTGAASLTITRGSVINLATGNEVMSGSRLTMFQRYFCAEDTSATITVSADSVGQVDGYYTTNGALETKSNTFKDVKQGDWFYAAVEYAYAHGLFSGTSSDTFSPNIPMTRAMFVTVLYRLDGQPAVQAETIFSDVRDATQYYYGPVSWANANGIVTGYENGTFIPGGNITREQMAVIMHRYADYKNYATTGDSAIFDGFPDNGSVSSYAVDAMKWATFKGIINGSDGKLQPGNMATRAQVAQIILNFCEKIVVS